MSAKTSTSMASSATSTRQSRASGYTIMTAYGSRRIRRPQHSDAGAFVPGQSPPRKRYPLIFQDPDEYDRRRRQQEDSVGFTPRSKGQASSPEVTPNSASQQHGAVADAHSEQR
ncbi:uncharacterized protein LOC118477193 [Aplysia californica]|nr:uncharacterized protein LOC118477193 [Aplysia californica]